MKSTLLLTALLCCSLIGFSQTSGKIKYGLFSGVNVANIHITVPGRGNATSESKVGANFGVLAEIPVSQNIAIQPEIAYSSLGWKESGAVYADSGAFYNPKYNLNYLTIPVLFKYKILPTVRNGNGLALYLGPQYGYLVNANLKAGKSSGSLGMKEGFKTSDFSAVGGAEYFMAAGLGISVRYQLGLANVMGSEAGAVLYEMYGSTVSVKNNSLSVTVGYRF